MLKTKSKIVALLLFSLFLNNSCNTESSNKSQTTRQLKVISYNVWYGFTKEAQRKKSWINWMKEQSPDVVVLQELNEYTEEALARDAKEYGHSYAVLLKEDGFPTGITSRHPIEDVNKTLDGFHHGLLRVKIQGIYFYVIHLHPSNWEFRIAEIKRIQSDIESLPPHSKILLAGDFNTFSPLDSVFYSHGRLEPFFNERDRLYQEKNLNNGKLDYTVIQEVMDFGYTDMEAYLRDSDYQFTGSFPTRVKKEGDHGDKRRLDFVFASPNLLEKVLEARIVANDTTYLLSDHLPVVINIYLEN